MKPSQKLIVYGSAVALRSGKLPPSAVLMRGPSGSGKSDLSFRLIEAGGVLIGDDQVELERRQKIITASAVSTITGLLEVRGIGLLKYPIEISTPLRLVIDLVPRDEVPRLPEWETVDILGIAIPRLKLHAFEGSMPLKIVRAIELVHKPDLLV